MSQKDRKVICIDQLSQCLENGEHLTNINNFDTICIFLRFKMCFNSSEKLSTGKIITHLLIICFALQRLSPVYKAVGTQIELPAFSKEIGYSQDSLFPPLPTFDTCNSAFIFVCPMELVCLILMKYSKIKIIFFGLVSFFFQTF